MKEVTFITGASSGFGQACAVKFNQENHPLILVARRKDKLIELKSKLNNDLPIYIIKADIRDKKAIKEALGGLPDELKNIEILINSAGLSLGIDPIYSSNDEDLDTMIDTNIKGLVNCTTAIIPKMVERNKGHIINIGSITGNWVYPGSHVYGATKAFVQNFSQAMRSDLIGKKVRVTNIEPGLAETEFSKVRFKGDDNKAAAVYKGTKPLQAEDIAQIVYFCSSVPAHVNINTLEVMPTCQAWNALAIHRD